MGLRNVEESTNHQHGDNPCTSTTEAIAMPSTKSSRRQSNSTARSNRYNFSIPGTDARRLVWTTREVIRALIDCTSYCNDCLPRSGNKLIVDPPSHGALRHEARA